MSDFSLLAYTADPSTCTPAPGKILTWDRENAKTAAQTMPKKGYTSKELGILLDARQKSGEAPSSNITNHRSASSRSTSVGNGASSIDEPCSEKRLQHSKTKACPWNDKGKCFMADKCNYAHSKAELRDKPNLQCTKLCHHIEKGRNCTNMSCRFAHNFNELRATSAFYKTKLCKFWAEGFCPGADHCRHAHGEKDLREPFSVGNPPLKEPSGSRGRRGSVEMSSTTVSPLATTSDISAHQTGVRKSIWDTCGVNSSLGKIAVSGGDEPIPFLAEWREDRNENDCKRAVENGDRELGSASDCDQHNPNCQVNKHLPSSLSSSTLPSTSSGFSSAQTETGVCTSGMIAVTDSTAGLKRAYDGCSPYTSRLTDACRGRHMSTSFGTRLPQFNADVPNTAFNVPNTAFNVPNTAFNVPNTAFNVPNTAFNVPNTAFNAPNTCTPVDVPSMFFDVPKLESPWLGTYASLALGQDLDTQGCDCVGLIKGAGKLKAPTYNEKIFDECWMETECSMENKCRSSKKACLYCSQSWPRKCWFDYLSQYLTQYYNDNSNIGTGNSVPFGMRPTCPDEYESLDDPPQRMDFCAWGDKCLRRCRCQQKYVSRSHICCCQNKDLRHFAKVKNLKPAIRSSMNFTDMTTITKPSTEDTTTASAHHCVATPSTLILDNYLDEFNTSLSKSSIPLDMTSTFAHSSENLCQQKYWKSNNALSKPENLVEACSEVLPFMASVELDTILDLCNLPNSSLRDFALSGLFNAY